MAESPKGETGVWVMKALYAVENEGVHELWAHAITNPLKLSVLEQLSNGTIVSGDSDHEKLSRSLRHVISKENRFISCTNNKHNCI